MEEHNMRNDVDTGDVNSFKEHAYLNIIVK